MSTDRLYSIDVRTLPLWAAVLPLVTINICYLVSISLDHLPACIPYISGCTSVSSTGRLPPESLIFRAGMLPLAVVVLLVWRRCATFLELGGQSGVRLTSIRLLGVAAALSLVLYTVTLGLAGNEYKILRRIGIDGELAKWLGVSRHPANNIVAWNALILQCAYFAILSRLWRQHGFGGEFHLVGQRDSNGPP